MQRFKGGEGGGRGRKGEEKMFPQNWKCKTINFRVCIKLFKFRVFKFKDKSLNSSLWESSFAIVMDVESYKNLIPQ